MIRSIFLAITTVLAASASAAPLKIACVGDYITAGHTLASIEVIDCHIQLGGHRDWFLDDVHPNTRGTAVMAAIAHDVIRGVAVPPSASLNMVRGANNRAIITWPAEAAGFVLQTTTLVADTSGWTVADSIPARTAICSAPPTSSARPPFFASGTHPDRFS